MTRFKQADLKKIRTINIDTRHSKAAVRAFAWPINSQGAHTFFDSLPDFLKAADLKQFIYRVTVARRKGFPFIMMMGAHVIKVGLSPIIIDLMEKGLVTGISLNSAGLIHDLELAFNGETSEDVQVGLEDGTFGMARETGDWFAGVVDLAEKENIGLGEAAGMYINRRKARYRRYSLMAASDRLHLPAMVHLVIGTDIVQQQPSFRPGPTAEASYRDFKILSRLLIDVDRGGAVANIGSAVILPEVFLKALTVARNLKKRKSNITTANFDMINHYRPMVNVVSRPTSGGGRGFNFIGHHEIMIPLLAWGLNAYISESQKKMEIKK
nr:hypothetical protein [candidate division Zixibacteria bacterium]